MKQYFNTHRIDDVMFLNPKLLKILAFVVGWCEERNLPCNITSMIRKPNDGISQSRTHQTARAFDMSVKKWATDDIDDLIVDVTNNFKEYGAISLRDGESRPVIFHNSGYGDHFHFQVRP